MAVYSRSALSLTRLSEISTGKTSPLERARVAFADRAMQCRQARTRAVTRQQRDEFRDGLVDAVRRPGSRTAATRPDLPS